MNYDCANPKCYLCEESYLLDSLVYDNLIDAYICRECFDKMENENNPKKEQCEDCGKFFDKDKFNDIGNNSDIPFGYLCDNCLEGWDNYFEEEETKESMMPGRI